MIRPVNAIALPILLLSLFVAKSLALPIPDTGQTQSHTETFGEDPDYTINPPSYTKLDAQGNALPDEATEWTMVRDNVTGLIWELKTYDESIHDRDNTYTWCDNNPDTNGGNAGTCGDGTDTEDFISVLNAENFGGFSDWRLPAREELRSIADDGRYNPSISPDYFPNTISSSSTYWSSSTYASNVSDAWDVCFDNGSGGRLQKHLSHYVRAVRGGQSQSSGALVINGDGTVTDTDTGLMWQQATASNDMIWEDALSYCENLSLGGYDDWRLPNFKELASLLDLTRLPTIDPAYLYSPDTVSPHCWSSTTFATHDSTAWLVDFNDGITSGNVKWLNSHSVRAVRGGQEQIESHLLISEPVQASTWHVGESMPITWETQDIAGNVRVSISRDGGKTYENIVEATENDGTYEWVVTVPQSVNCTLRIEPISEPEKGTTQGFFSIYRNSVGDNAIDTDSDGLSNLEEFHANTDPNNHDTDSDGMPDIWELGNALGPNADDANGDYDQDGSSNIREFQNGTDPRDSSSHRSLIPEAGQEDCYDINGDLIDPCPSSGDSLYGQDANYTINPQSYTKLNAQGEALPDPATEWLMVRDDVTGLVWEVKQSQDGSADYANPNDADNTYTWHDSNTGANGGYAGVAGNGTDTEDFVQTLNDSFYGGHSDWRIPSVRELSTIDNHGGHLEPIDPNYFPNIAPHSFYWSASSRLGIPDEAWATLGASVRSFHKSNEYCIRAVRGGGRHTSFQLVDNANGTLTDTSTGFMWQYEASAQSLYWESALNYCETLSLDGHDDWRLPNKSETQSLIDYDDDLTIFPDRWADMTSTGVNETILVREDGGIHGHPKTEWVGYVRCVRAGQNEKADSLLVLSPQQASAWRAGDAVTVAWDTRELADDVSISISRDGGMTYEDISQNTENDGAYYWTVTGPASVNCMLKIEPVGDPSKGTIQGLFTIDIDSDSDGMLDAWETSHFGDLSHDGTADSDTDGLNDLQEYQSNTDPNQTDTDGDGMSDSWEVSNSLDPNADDTGSDADGDRFTNMREYQDQTNPNDPASHLILPEANSRIPDTGQTQCYDADDEHVCPQEGEAFYGQDGSYTINPPSYIKMDARGRYLADSADSWTMVRDNVTGLIWEVKTDDGSVHDRDNTYTWCDGNPDTNGGDAGSCGSGTDTEDFVSALNATGFGGFSDWRLPTREELRSIVDYGTYDPAIDTTLFPNTRSDFYWSATINSASIAWCTDFQEGGLFYEESRSKSDSCLVRAVRRRQSFHNTRFEDNGDGTVTDTDTGLIWEQVGSDDTMNWEDTLSHCEDMVLAGHDDWRAPNIKELTSIAGYDLAIGSSYIMSSTTRADISDMVWLMAPLAGGNVAVKPQQEFQARGVRGGQSILSDHLAISAPQQADHRRLGEQIHIAWETQSIGGNVKIALSRDGGKTFETISENTENDGSHTWTVAGAASVNCVLKIEPLGDPTRGTSQGLFTIADTSAPPDIPSSPSPAHRRSYVTVNADLSWTGGDRDTGDTVTYDVYFGTSSTPSLVASNQGANTYDPGELTDNTLYYWKTVARDSHGLETEGQVWSFDTGYDTAGDSDSDGMMDNWEYVHFGDLSHTGSVDTDTDGLTDLQEYQYDTSPNNDDSDGDRMPDGWEVNNSLDPTVDDTGTDSDGDGFTDAREYEDQTDLYDPASHLVLPETTGRIPDTGQIKCYNNSVEIACPQEGEQFHGQDANYTINPPSYIKMDSQGNYLPDSATSWVMVRDNVSGLMWEAKTDDGSVHDKDNTYTWCDNNPDTNGGNAGTCGNGTDTEDFINALNAENYGGHADWRLPTRKELRPIADYGETDPAVSVMYFPNTVTTYPAWHWSSTTNRNDANLAWRLAFYDGSGDYGGYDNGKSESYGVRAVRGGHSQSANGLAINDDHTVTDTSNGLMWRRNASASEMTWQEAISYCVDLADESYDDWRLPNTKEIASLEDFNQCNPAVGTAHFPDDPSGRSSTTNANVSYFAWANGCGNDGHQLKSDSSYVYCVRGGQNRIGGSLYATNPTQASTWDVGESMPITWETRDIIGNIAISISRDGGKTYESIAESTENDGTHEWIVTVPHSVNCMLKIEPIDDAEKSTTEGLFSIRYDLDSDGVSDDVDECPATPPGIPVLPNGCIEPRSDYPRCKAAIIPVGHGPKGIGITPDGSTVYVANDGEGTVSVILSSGNSVIDTIEVGGAPTEVAVTPDGKHVYITNSGSHLVSVIRTSDNTWLMNIDVGPGPSGVVVTPDGRSVYVANHQAGMVSVIRTLDNEVIKIVDVGAGPNGISITPDGSTVYVANDGDGTVSVIQTSDNTVVGNAIPVGWSPFDLDVTPDGRHVYVSNRDNSVYVIETSSNTVIQTIHDVGEYHHGIAVTPDGAHVYVVNHHGSSVSVIRTSDNAVIDTLGTSSQSYLAISPDGSTVFVANENNDTVTVFGICEEVDSDMDGMPDDWENAGFGDLSHDGTLDTDSDGLSDLQEFHANTDPNNHDTDNDGMDDYWEVDHGLNPSMRDFAEDPDGDKFTNGREYQDQTDPNDPLSYLILPEGTGRISDTGQIKCYENYSEIVCPEQGEPFYGQDGSYTINPPSYIKMDAQGNYLADDANSWAMVRDNITGLIWEVKTDDGSIHDKDDTYTWCDSNPGTNGGNAGICGDGTDTEDFIDTLDNDGFGGFSDWRLPTREELRSIADYGRHDPAIGTSYFPNTALSNYWSSTTYALYTDHAWRMFFNYGDDNPDNKSYGYSVRAVRGGQPRSSGGSVINGDGTVTDTTTGLMWQQATSPVMDWQNALSYCEEMDLGGHADWRLPSIKELSSLADLSRHEPAIDTIYFPDTVTSEYWSSTTYVFSIVDAFRLHFSYGYDLGGSGKYSSYYVRAVRGGQKQTLGNLTISTPNQASLWIAGQSMPITWDIPDIEGNVRISVSRAGGKAGTFETIVEDTENDGSYDWSVSGPSSADCVIRIEPLTDLSKANSVGLFTIDLVTFGYIIADPIADLQEYDLSLIAIHEILGEREVETAWSLSDPDLADIDGNVLTAKGNGCVTVTVDYAGREYRELICLKAGFDQMETESNNTLLTSTDLTEGRFMEGELLYEDVDYYKISISSDSIVEISYSSQSHFADVGIEVFDGSDNLLATAVSVDGESLLFLLGLVAGDYYVKLTPAGDIDQSGIYDVVYGIYAVLPVTGAAHIAFDDTREGRISHLQDAREYTFELDREEVGISFVPSTHTIDYHIEIRKDEELVQEIDTVPGESFEIESITGSGSYSLLVTSGQVIDAASSFSIRITKKNLVEDEPNDIYQAATDFFIGEEIKGWLGGGDDTDFYTLRTSAPVYVDLLFECYGCGIEHDIEVYKDSDQNLINGIKIGDGESTTLTMGLGIGRYYLKIAAIPADDDTAYPYSLTLNASAHNDLEIESNNTYRFANPISKEETIKGRIFADADTDYFGFYLPEFTVFMVDFTAASATADYRLSLVDKDGNEFYYKTSSDGEAMTLRANRPAGTYFVNIQSNGDIDLYNDYELVLRTDAEINPGNQIIGENNIVSLSVSAASGSIAVDEEVQLTATGHYQDTTSGTVENVVWSCLDPDIASISGTGVLTGITDGYATIVGIHGWLTGQFTLMIGNPVQAVSQHYGNLILVAGGGVEASNTLKESTQYLSDLVYLRFQNRLFTDEDIYYFNAIPWHDIDGDGYGNDIVDDASPTVTEFGQSVTEWAVEQSTNGPLYIYLIDHGGIDTFKIFPNEILTAVQLKGLIDTFQTATDRQVIVMIEACKSGSFTDDLVTGGQDRIAVTCTDDQDAYMQLQGRISFTQFFMDRLLTGDSIQKGYLKAKNQLSNMGLPYNRMNAQLVEGVSLASNSTMIGGDFAIASLFPEITSQSASTSVTADTIQTFFAELSDLEGIEAVWAVVIPPDYVPPVTSQDLEAPEVGLPSFDLTDPDKDGRHEGTYSDFTHNGDYRITFYARNENGSVTASPASIIAVTGGQDLTYIAGDVNGDGSITLADAILSLKIACGLDTTGENIRLDADVNSDNVIGLAEMVYAIQVVSGLRSSD